MLTMNDQEFDRIVKFVRENYGINLIKKKALVQGRLGLDIKRRGYSSFGEYFDEVMSHPGGLECQHMIDKISTNHTFFFREPECFEHMRDTAVPALIQKGVKKINIWCAAASTGQECYSIAMMMEEALMMYRGVDYHILGSDINAEVLETGKKGVYANAELAGIPERFCRRYCTKCGEDSFAMSKILKEHITWKKINLVKQIRIIGSQHLVFCRNVMIYFEPATKETITSELHSIVCDGGFVYVGNTETLDMKRTRFNYLGPAIFEKRKVAL